MNPLTTAAVTAGVAVLVPLAKHILSRLMTQSDAVKGKVVLITGASSGIGKALAYRCYRQGAARLILASRNVDQLNKIKADLDQSSELRPTDCPPAEVRVHRLDLASSESIEEFAKLVLAGNDRLDLLVNNAGIGCRGSVMDTEVDTYRRVLEVNFIGQVAVTKALLPLLLKSRGAIVGISSLQGKFALPLRSAYGASKHALQAFYDSLRMETAAKGVNVHVISPSYVKGDFGLHTVAGDGCNTRTPSEDQQKASLTPEKMAEAVMNVISSGETDVNIGPVLHRLMPYVKIFSPSTHSYILRKRSKL